MFFTGPVEVGADRPATSPTRIPKGGKAPDMASIRISPDLGISTPREDIVARAEVSEEQHPPQVPVSVLPSSQLKIGGRLANFFQAWISITRDAWILQTVQGFHIEYLGEPSQQTRPRPIQFSLQEAALADEEVSSLLNKGTIFLSSPHPRGFISNIFLVD